MKYEVRQIEAWNEPGPDGAPVWTYNDWWRLGEYETHAADHKRAFLRYLHEWGITCKRGKCVVVYDGDLYELQDRKTGEPLFVAIPMD